MISAFKQIRLSGLDLSFTTASRLMAAGNQVVYASDTGVLATAANLQSTGSFLQSLISSSSAGVTSLGGLTGVIAISGAGNVSVIQSGNGWMISGNTGAYTNFATNTALTATGAVFVTFTGNQQTFLTGINPTGFDTYQVNFPQVFSSVPKVYATIEVFGSVMYNVNIKSRTTSSFSAIFSDNIAETGVVLHVMATVN